MATALATGSDDYNDTSDRLTKVEATVARLEERVERLEAVNARLRQVDDRQAARGGDLADSLGNMALNPTNDYLQYCTNVGGAYNNKTGIFTAPVRGVYVFEFTLMIDPGYYQYLELVKDGVHVLWNYGTAAGNTNSTSRTATSEVQKGGQVWVRTKPDKDHGNGIIHGNTFTTFSGWLVDITE